MGVAIGAAALLLAGAPLVAAEEHEENGEEEELATPPEELVLSQSGFSVPGADCALADLNALINDQMGIPTDSTFISLAFAGGATNGPVGDVYDVSYDLTGAELVIGLFESTLPAGTTVTGTWDGVTGDFNGTMTVPDSTIVVNVEDPPIGDVDINVSIPVGPVTGNISPEDFGGTLSATASINLLILLGDGIPCEIGPFELAMTTDPVERPDPPPPAPPVPPEEPIAEVEAAPAPAQPVAPTFTG